MKFVHGDLSFEDLFRRFFIFRKKCSWRFVLWWFLQGIFPFSWRFVHGDFSFEILNRRFIPWRFVQEIFPLKICSWRFFLLWRCGHGDLSFENLKLRWFFLLWRYVHGNFSFENLFIEIFPLKLWSLGDFSSFNFLQEKQELTSSQLTCTTHELPLFDLFIWWLWYVWTYSCKCMIQKSLDLMRLNGVKVWIYLIGFHMGDLTRMRHSSMPLVSKLKHDFENLDFWGKDDFFLLFQNGWGMAKCPVV